MTISHTKRVLPLLVAGAALALASGAAVAQATPAPTKFVFSSYWGWEVNQTTGGDICTVASKNKCSEKEGQVVGRESAEPGGFKYPESVAVDNDPASPEYNDVYVADQDNHRVQVFSPTGVFVSMFGREVNETTKGNVCTEAEIVASDVKCKAGVEGSAAGQFGEAGPEIVAIDPANGNVYVTDRVDYFSSGRVFTGFGWRVQEFTAEGKFVLEIGKEVNETTEGNLCTQKEAEKGTKCKGPKEQPINTPYEWGSEHGAFNLDTDHGNLLAVGGPEDLLYVGDEHRVQEFKADGEWKGEIPLTSISAEPESRVVALAVDGAGDVYLAYQIGANVTNTNVVREFNPSGVQSSEFEILPRKETKFREFIVTNFTIEALALDSYGRLGVLTYEKIQNRLTDTETETFNRGALYSTTGAKITEFEPPSGSLPGLPSGLAFAASSDGLYFSTQRAQVVGVFTPVGLFPEAVTCAASGVQATSAVLCGTINPNEVSTRGFFEYQPAAGSRTPIVFEGDGTTPEALSAHVTGLEPNETYRYATVAEAEVEGKEETGHGEQFSFHTATPPPEVQGSPSASDVTNAFALLSASVNPEHAPARYHFQYGPCAALAGCASAASTPDQESSVYGQIGVVQEVVGLQPQTTYSYRLVADNEHEEAGHVAQGGETTGTEGHFTTGASPIPVAQTGSASGVGATSATIAGLVDPDGQPAVYAFELGVYNGPSTRYGVVFSGAAGASVTAVPESLELTGLQPGTTYAYRIVLKSGYGESTGQTVHLHDRRVAGGADVAGAAGAAGGPHDRVPGRNKRGHDGQENHPEMQKREAAQPQQMRGQEAAEASQEGKESREVKSLSEGQAMSVVCVFTYLRRGSDA